MALSQRVAVLDAAPMRFDANSPVRILDRADCRELLQRETVGRVAFANGAFPMVLPINYVYVDDLIVFRTDVGLKLENVPMRAVAFEIDGRSDASAWSVVVLGHAREVTTALGPRYDALRKADISVVAPGSKVHWIAIEIQEVSGRIFPIEPAPADQ